MNSQFTVEDIHSGLLNKCGGKVKSWNKRWFVLKTDYCLYYYKDIAKGHLGVITLRDTQFKVRQGEAGDVSWPKGTKMECAITMVTTNRTYFMHAASAEEANEWLRVLMETKKKLAESCITRKSPSNSATSATQSSQEDDSNQDTSDVKQHHNGHVTENGTSPNDELATDSLYDVAKAPNEEHESSQSSQSESTTPEMKPKQDDLSKQQQEPPTIYDDVPFEEQQQQQQQQEPPAIYDDVPFEKSSAVTPPITQPVAIYEQLASEDSPSIYDQVGPEQPSPIQSQPLPPLPVATSVSGSNKNGQAIYEDVPTSQPLYEPIIDSTADNDKRNKPVRRENAQEAEDSAEEDNTLPPPPLPPKDDDILPPLPPKDTQPLLLPKDNELPEKNTPPSPRKRGNKLPLPEEGSPPSPGRRGSNEPIAAPRSPSSSGTPPKKPSPTPRRRKTSPADDTVKVEVHDASESEKNASERGLELFRQRGEKLDEMSEQDTKRRAESMRTLETVSGDPKLSVHDKAKFAETLREVEHERLKASEERFRWERERMKLEEERRKFEAEKRKLQEEIEVTRQQLHQKEDT